MANEVLKAQTARVRLQKMKGEVVDRARATAMVFDLARRERDAWLNWPPRVAADKAWTAVSFRTPTSELAKATHTLSGSSGYTTSLELETLGAAQEADSAGDTTSD